MKILVAIKRVVDYNVRIQIKPDGSGVMLEGVKMSINPFDEIALEEAIRLKEKGLAESITVVTVAGKQAEEQLRQALAMGADHALRVDTDQDLQPINIARVLEAIVKREAPDLILMGKQAIDDDCSQTPQMLAGLLDWPQATFVSKLELADGWVRVSREVDAGLEELSVRLPAIISADLRLNEPRYVKLPDIMKARRKPIDILTLDDLSVAMAPQLEIVKTAPPPPRKPGRKLASIEELITELKQMGVLS